MPATNKNPSIDQKYSQFRIKQRGGQLSPKCTLWVHSPIYRLPHQQKLSSIFESFLYRFLTFCKITHKTLLIHLTVP